MRTRLVITTLVLLLGTPLVTGCSAALLTDPDLRPEARDLAEDVRSMAGVADVELDYTSPVPLDSGKLVLEVRMAPEASTDQALDVLTAVHEELASTHAGEEGDVDVLLGDDRVHLRTFQPRAGAEEVREQAALALDLADRGSLAVRIDADEPSSEPFAHTEAAWTLPAGSTGTQLPGAVRDLADHADPRLTWTVAAADGSAVGGDDGVPTPEDLATWQRLRDVPLAGATTTVTYDELVTPGGRRIAWVDVDVHGSTAPLRLEDPADRRALQALAQAQVDVLRATSDEMAYRLLLDGQEVALADDSLGAFGTREGRRLAEDLLER